MNRFLATLGSVLRFGPVKPEAVEKPKKEPKVKAKLDPRLKEAARELRDRWLEQVNAGSEPSSVGKYNVARKLAAAGVDGEVTQRLIAA